MVSNKKGLDSEEESDSEELETQSTSSDSSDVSVSEDEVVANEEESESENEEIAEDEEDEVIKAIKKENNKQREHPPPILAKDFVLDISFHPNENIFGIATITGEVTLYKYSNEENTILFDLELHTEPCRDIEFSSDGLKLFSVGKDRSVMLSDTLTGKLTRFFDDAHDAPIYCVSVLDENLFATGKSWQFFLNFK